MSKERRAQYYKGAADHWLEGCRLQAERLHPKNQTTDSFRTARHDLNFYTVAVVRLLNVAEQARDRLPGNADELRSTLDAFNKRWPRFRELRDSEEHIKDPERHAPLGIWYFLQTATEVFPDGSVQDLVDAEDMQPYLETLHTAITKRLEPFLTATNRPQSFGRTSTTL